MEIQTTALMAKVNTQFCARPQLLEFFPAVVQAEALSALAAIAQFAFADDLALFLHHHASPETLKVCLRSQKY